MAGILGRKIGRKIYLVIAYANSLTFYAVVLAANWDAVPVASSVAARRAGD